MRISINKGSIFFAAIMISLMIPGVIGESIFWTVIIFLLYLNRKSILGNAMSRGMLGILVAYYLLFFIKMMTECNPDEVVRLFGITKCCAGIPICVLLAKSFIQRLPCKTIVWGSILICIAYILSYQIIDGVVSSRFEIFNWILNLGSINLCGAICVVILPHLLFGGNLISRYKKLLFYIVFLLVFIIYPSGSLIGSVIIILLMSVYYLVREKKYNILFGNRIYSLFVLCTILALVTNYKVLNNYIYILKDLDIDRYNILNYAITEFENFSYNSQMFGVGDNVFYLGMNRTSAHNMILEILRVYGIMGLVVAVIEFYLIMKILIAIRTKKCFVSVLCSTILCYFYFMLHPFYETSFILKFFFVLLNYKSILSEKNKGYRKTGEGNLVGRWRRDKIYGIY